MPASPLPHHSGDDADFVPEYTPPAWYLEGLARTADPQPWHTVSAQFPPPDDCRVCGAAPAITVTIRAHQGLLLAMRWRTATSRVCATCGIALVREMTTKTLWQGWWGIGSLIFGTPFALISNWGAYRKLRQLQRQPAVAPGDTRQLPLGVPILHRPQAYVALIPLIWAAVLITH